jgi:hypothetical protein
MPWLSTGLLFFLSAYRLFVNFFLLLVVSANIA